MLGTPVVLPPHPYKTIQILQQIDNGNNRLCYRGKIHPSERENEDVESAIKKEHGQAQEIRENSG